MGRRLPASPAQQLARPQAIIMESVPSPTGGWNARDALADMPPTDAVRLENWFPRVSDCTIRGGEVDYVTGFTKKLKTLALYTPPGGPNQMFAANDDGIFDATATGVVGAAEIACTNGYFNWTQMGVSGGHYLIMPNGKDELIYYDGTTWIVITAVSAPAITGLPGTTADLVSASIFKRRLMFCMNDTLSFWYLDVDVVGGAILEFDLGPLCNSGGFLMAIGTWTVDAGNGPDDYAVFVTSEGQVVVFKGDDPSLTTNWALVGVYDLKAKPIGRKCLKKYGGDLVIITQFGALPLAKMILAASISYKVALTDKIQNAFTLATQLGGSLEGWEAEVFPAQSAFIFNIPVFGDTYNQYVMNTVTKSWCKFSGWNASAFVVFNGQLFFADTLRVANAWVGAADHGTNIQASAQTAYNYFAVKSRSKEWTLMRPVLQIDGTLTFGFGLSIDFEDNTSLPQITYQVSGAGIWDVSLWDVGLWSPGLSVKKDWQTPFAFPGYCASGMLQIASNSSEVVWISTDYGYIPAGVMG